MLVRVRFAPSPTGELHIGGARTALFNWLFARHHGGVFILRIEDTDAERSTGESARHIVSALRWLGLDWDEGPEVGGPHGPYFQSERLPLYGEHARRLLDSGKAYLCYCTPEELAALREEARKAGRPPRYDRRCRDLTPDVRQRCQEEGRRPTVRLRVPDEGTTEVEDLIRGRVVFDNAVLDDFIIMKSDGMPTYNFACVVDDMTMGITHVIRAEEHLSNTPKQILLYRALAESSPVFAHVPMILAPDRSKLSKRHGATSVQEFRQEGYLPEALVNYLALLGWSPADGNEILGIDTMIRTFSLERVGKTAAVYDVKKLSWLNGHYMREIGVDRLSRELVPFLEKAGCAVPDGPRLRQAVAALRERARTLAELADAASCFFCADGDLSYEEKGVRKHFRAEAAAILARAREALAGVEEFTPEYTEKAYRELAEALEIPSGRLFHPTRLALTGRTVGPGLFDVMAILGKEKTLARLERAVRWIRSCGGRPAGPADKDETSAGS